jgi:PadR family transcriptional regulator
MKILSRAEEIILLAILQLEGEAYGLSIRSFIKKTTGREWSLAQIYDPLSRMSNKGYVRKSKGAPSAERGGRHKCLYAVTPDGKNALRKLRSLQERIWARIGEKV